MEQNEIIDKLDAVIEKYIPGFDVISYLAVKEPTEPPRIARLHAKSKTDNTVSLIMSYNATQGARYYFTDAGHAGHFSLVNYHALLVEIADIVITGQRTKVSTLGDVFSWEK